MNKSSFSNTGGLLIIISLIAEKIVNFLLMVLAARFMTLTELGAFSFIKSIVGSVLPFSGLGASHSLLRFGSQTDEIKKHYSFLFTALFYGSIFSLLLILILYQILNITSFLDQVSKNFLNYFILYIFTYFIFDLSRNFFRLRGDNKQYSMYGLKYSLINFFLASICLIYFDNKIFLISLVLSPLITLFISNKSMYTKFKFSHNFNSKFWKYGFSIGLGAFINQLFLQADVLVLGFSKIDLNLLAQYKIASLVIFTFFLIPNSFLLRDFTLLAKNSQSSEFLNTYIKKYLRYATLGLITFIPLFYFISQELITLVFGADLNSKDNIQNILLLAFTSGVLLRMPFAHVINAGGKAGWNVVNAVFTLCLSLGLLFFFVPSYGTIGAAYILSIMYFISGLISLTLYFIYIKYCVNHDTVPRKII